MNCAYHPEAESQEACGACKKPLCAECIHKIKGKTYCQDCLAEGAEWAATVRNLRLPSDAPRRAAVCALIPGIGAVYNSEYLKAITFFAVFAALCMMGNSVNPVFGWGAFAFLVFTMFDAYRTAEFKTRKRFESGGRYEEPPLQDKTIVGWGVFLMLLGVIFLLQNVIPPQFLSRLWPLVFVFLGAYLVYRALRNREDKAGDASGSLVKPKEGI